MPLKFDWCNITDTKESEVYNNATKKIGVGAMLLLLRRPLWDSSKFCAFQKVSETDDSHEESPGTTVGLREGKGFV